MHIYAYTTIFTTTQILQSFTTILHILLSIQHFCTTTYMIHSLQTIAQVHRPAYYRLTTFSTTCYTYIY